MNSSDVDRPGEKSPFGNGSGIGRSVKISERIAAALVADIVAGGLPPGSRLPNEAAMLERFQVGRASLREALRILEIYGLIILQPGPGGGPIVSAIDARSVARTFSLYLNLVGASILELQEARLQIEPVIARMAAEERNPDAMARLRAALDLEAGIATTGTAYIDAANNFHATLATLTSNKVLNLLATALQDLYIMPLVAVGVPSQTSKPSIRNEHRAIGEAILEGDADLAEVLTRRHVSVYLDRLKAVAPEFASSTVTWS
jgi:GntR family transcriptional regulator, transcriptional repressor for pyruvate dehydrogenase complex